MSRPLPTPVDVPAGHIVRVRLGGHCYHSGFLAPALAAQQAEQLDVARRDRLHSGESVLFATADGRTIRINARSISAIESGPPPSHWRDRDRRLDEPIELVPAQPDVERGIGCWPPAEPSSPDPAVPSPLNLGRSRGVPRFPAPAPRPVRDNPQA